MSTRNKRLEREASVSERTLIAAIVALFLIVAAAGISAGGADTPAVAASAAAVAPTVAKEVGVEIPASLLIRAERIVDK